MKQRAEGSIPSLAAYRGVAQLVEAREKTYLVFACLTLTGKGLVLKTSSSRASGVSVRVREQAPVGFLNFRLQKIK